MISTYTTRLHIIDLHLHSYISLFWTKASQSQSFTFRSMTFSITKSLMHDHLPYAAVNLPYSPAESYPLFVHRRHYLLYGHGLLLFNSVGYDEGRFAFSLWAHGSGTLGEQTGSFRTSCINVKMSVISSLWERIKGSSEAGRFNLTDLYNNWIKQVSLLRPIA